MDEAGHVFLSYGRLDGEEIASGLRDTLRDTGFATWMERFDFQQGTDWNATFDEALAQSFALVVVLTPAAVSSPHVRNEWLAALIRGVPVIPLLALACQLPNPLAALDILDLRTDYEAQFAALCQQLTYMRGSFHSYLKQHMAALERVRR